MVDYGKFTRVTKNGNSSRTYIAFEAGTEGYDLVQKYRNQVDLNLLVTEVLKNIEEVVKVLQ